jgi:acylphosphatase
MANLCKRVTYAGRVQGVGFRYTAQHLAAGYPRVAGYVRNLPSGDVELVAEGPAEDVNAFLAAVAQGFAENIERAMARDEAPSGCQGFHIRY